MHDLRTSRWLRYNLVLDALILVAAGLGVAFLTRDDASSASGILFALSSGWAILALLAAALWSWAGPPAEVARGGGAEAAYDRSRFLALAAALLVAVALALAGGAVAWAEAHDGEDRSGEPEKPVTTAGEPPVAEAPEAAATPSPDVPAAMSDEEAEAALATLKLREKPPSEPYDRGSFGRWRSKGGGCNTRRSVLIRDARQVTATPKCVIESGTWVSVYDNRTITVDAADIKRLGKEVDIDHVVPLKHAWRFGASEWSREQRVAFANDTENSQLVAVSGSSNRSKGAQGPDEWPPPEGTAWCPYSRWWIQVKAHWRLTTTRREKRALRRMLTTC